MKIVPKPFWNEDSARISSTLWLPSLNLIEREWTGELVTEGWGTCVRSASDQPITDCLSASTAECATVDKKERAAKRRKREEEQTEKQQAEKVRRFRLYPTTEQKAILRNWFGTARWTYNRCLDAVEKKEVAKNKKDLRAAFLNKDAIDNMGKPWVLETPYDIRNAAMQDLLNAYDSAHARYTNDKKVFKIKHRSRRKSRQESIVIHHKHWSRVKGKYAFLRKMKSAEPLPHDLNYDSRLVYQRTTGHYYLCVPMPLRVLDGPSSGRLISLDPGVRTFLTGYSPDGEAIELGKNDIGHIYRLCHWLDELHSKYSVKDISPAGKLRRRIQNLVSDMHCRIAKYLCTTFNLVILPSFPVQQMVMRKGGQRRIRSKTARAMATWSHYRFQQRLLDKAREYKSCKVVLVSEEYTSKTCGRCGKRNDVGSSKKYSCKECRFECDRDVNGARNILVRCMTVDRTVDKYLHMNDDRVNGLHPVQHPAL
ncbi:putative transposase DNA-binding domain-containing protein [Lipomyces tetrasporus]|uniref:Transposase DNA-binding domain-containing protein n=1 Tax=Lipomyces tetrasporus TaxID=54092 RepID=A0AAD7VQ15_9ASCO|nr:putative transposase DNA-binding domain-containing protein [Lipomyces tetrasporus]KAJ8098437.1 putative transposase DNA-binding domain-containing protein [Lipomyces tetrasporus]